MNRIFVRRWPSRRSANEVRVVSISEHAYTPVRVDGGEPARRARLFATWSLMIATAMQAADAVIVNVALPKLAHDLGGGVELGAWVMTSYLCAAAVVAPLTGWVRRRFGARHIFPAAVGVFIVASLLCALAPNEPAIILFRILQGAGGGLIHPLTQAMLLDLYPKERHGRILAIWGAALMMGPILGPALGGIITDLASWRWAFIINLPLGLLVIRGVRGALPKAESTEPVPLDAIGMLLLIAGIGALQLWLERSVGQSWLNSPELLGEGAIVVVAFTALALRAHRSGFTVFQPEVLKDVNFAAAAFYNFMTSALLFTTLVFVPLMGEGPLGYDATAAGFTIVPRGILMMLMILLMGRLIGKVDYRILLMSGVMFTAAGLATVSAVGPDSAAVWLVGGSTIQAVGAGMLFTPLSTIGFSTLAPERRTDASGLYSLLRQLGSASGVALMTAVLRVRLDAHLSGLAGEFAGAAIPAARLNAASLEAYADCFRMMAIAALVVSPGVLLFRPGAEARQIKKAA
jgi:DHA2 family multidrug resistance protein